MQISGLSPIVLARPAVNAVGVKTVALLGGVKQFLGIQQAEEPTTWQRFKTRYWNAMEYAPDIWSAMDSSIALAKGYAVLIPTHVRTAMAALATLNLTLLPSVTAATLTAVWEFLMVMPRHGMPGLLEGSARVVYLSSLTSALAAIGSTGLHHFAEKLELSTQRLEQFVGAIVPWAGYALRASAVVQMMDLWSGGSSNTRLTHLLRPVKLKRYISYALPRIELCGRGKSVIKIKPCEYYQRADEALQVLRSNERVYRKVVDGDTPLNEKINKIEGRLRSWLPPLSLLGRYQAMQLAQRLRDKNVVALQSHALGLTANMFAIMKMVAVANIVAASILGILSSIFYMIQTYHRQHATV
jgi:hypothetical protein